MLIPIKCKCMLNISYAELCVHRELVTTIIMLQNFATYYQKFQIFGISENNFKSEKKFQRLNHQTC